MIFFIANLTISFIVFLFGIYSLSKDDFILLRKNISLEQMFNYSFTSMWVMLLSARVFYVLFHPSLKYLNPLIFLIFIYFPGLSLLGGVIGVLIFLFFITRKKNIPRGRIFDIFSLGFLPAVVWNIVLAQLFGLIMTKKASLAIGIEAVVFLIASGILSFLFRRDKVKDGTVSLVILAIFSLASLLVKVFDTVNKKSLFFDKEAIILVVLFFVTAVLVVRQRIVRRKR